jgi:hypothetical protein
VSEDGRSRAGWGLVAALVCAVAVFAAGGVGGLSHRPVVHPALLLFVPLSLLFLALPPRRPLTLALALLIGWLALGGRPGGALWYFERGWALVLGAWFVALLALVPRWRVLSAALAAIGLSAATAAGLLLVQDGGFSQLDGAIATRLRAGASELLTFWTRSLGSERVGAELSRAVYSAAELQVKLYPAMLALASLAALGIAWWAYGRLGRGDRNPLRPLREFRFRDELVWLLVSAVVLMIFPRNQLAARAGQNLLAFMGALYALRGAAVLLVLGGGAPGPLGIVLGVLLMVFMTPFVMATTFLVGVSDTWLDLRAHRRAASNPPT